MFYLTHEYLEPSAIISGDYLNTEYSNNTFQDIKFSRYTTEIFIKYIGQWLKFKEEIKTTFDYLFIKNNSIGWNDALSF